LTKPSSCTKNPGFLPYLARQLTEVEIWAAHRGLTPMVYLFGGAESRAKNLKVVHENTEHREHDKFILVWASGE
jgi:hypothetical protein